jgi:hypothetical protein
LDGVPYTQPTGFLTPCARVPQKEEEVRAERKESREQWRKERGQEK